MCIIFFQLNINLTLILLKNKVFVNYFCFIGCFCPWKETYVWGNGCGSKKKKKTLRSDGINGDGKNNKKIKIAKAKFKKKCPCRSYFFCFTYSSFSLKKSVESSLCHFLKVDKILFVEYKICIVLFEY